MLSTVDENIRFFLFARLPRRSALNLRLLPERENFELNSSSTRKELAIFLIRHGLRQT